MINKNILILIIITFLPLQKVSADNISSEPWDQTISLLTAKEILTTVQRGKLKALLEQIYLQGDQNGYLTQSVLNRMDQKIADDRFQMQALLDTLKQISQNSIAEQIGNINKGELSDCSKKLKELNIKLKYEQPVFIKYEDRSGSTDVIKKIKDKSLLLLGGGSGPDFPDLWRSIRKMILPVYSKWNHLAVELSRRNKAGLNESLGNNYLSIEERRFLELFNQVQYNLRRFSEMRSDEF